MPVDKDGGSEGQAELSDDLEKAWDEAESGKEVVEEKSSDDDRPRDPETGKFVAKEKSEDDEPEEREAEADDNAEELDTDEPVEQVSALAPPEHWSQGDKDAFSALPDNLKPLYLEKAKSLESGYNKKFEEVATERKNFESYKGFKEIFEPHEQQLHMNGFTPESYTRRLVAIGQALQANAGDTIKWLAQQYNVDLGKPEGAEDEYADPTVSKLQAELGQIKTALQQFQQSQVQATHQSFEHEWLGFANAKDEQGHETFPGAEKLKVRMGQELSVSPQQPGETIRDALKRAYDSVKWVDPEIRQSILDAEAKAKDAERQRKEDLEKAKKAGRTVKSKSAPTTDERIPGKDWKDELERNWDQANA